MNKLALLHDRLHELESVLVAYSGGVDSSLLLAAAKRALGHKVLAVTASSELISPEEIAGAKELAAQLGVRHMVVSVQDLDNTGFTANNPDRCYHCKKYRFQLLLKLAQAEGLKWVVEGSNMDDLSDYRPGHRAVEELGIKSPLREAGLTKAEIRSAACQWDLPVWNKPAKPCLATRIPYGTPITRGALERIGKAETCLVNLLGHPQVRVREHGTLARLEIPRELFALVMDSSMAQSIYEQMQKLGYSYTALDLLGYRQGSMNESLESVE